MRTQLSNMKFFPSIARVTVTVLIIVSCAVVAHCFHEAVFRRYKGKYLGNHVVEKHEKVVELECGSLCSRKSSCASANFKTSGENQGMCELNNKTLENSAGINVREDPQYVNLGVVKRTCESPDEFFLSETKQCVRPVQDSCKGLLDMVGPLPDGMYNLAVNSSQGYPVYCHMSDIPGCGGGGWTLVMKLNGTKNTFNYTSPYWKDNRTYGVSDGLLTDTECKLESYWNTPFTKMCVGMKVDGVTKWIKLDYEATSLYSVIADGTFRSTHAGRSAWKSLIDGSSLQLHCNKEGFNFNQANGNTAEYIHVRFGFIGNDANDCTTICDSWIGFGILTIRDSASTGNFAKWGGDNGDRDTAAFGYILVS